MFLGTTGREGRLGRLLWVGLGLSVALPILAAILLLVDYKWRQQDARARGELIVQSVERNLLERLARLRLALVFSDASTEASSDQLSDAVAMPRRQGLPLYDVRVLPATATAAATPGLRLGALYTRGDRWWLPVIVSRADGSTVHARLDAAWLADLLRGYTLGPNDRLNLIGDDGALVARSHANAAYVGTRLADIPLFAPAYRAQVQGSYREVGRLDGVDRIFLFRRVPDTGLIVVAGIAESEIFVPWLVFAAAVLGVALLLATLWTLLLRWMVRDRRHQQQLMAQLEQAEGRLREAQTLAGIGDYEWEVDAGLVHWSETLFHIYGREPIAGPFGFEESIEQIHPDDVDVIRRQAERLLGEQGASEAEFRIIRTDGEVRQIYGRGALVQRGGRRVVHGVLQDITDLAVVRDALREAREDYRFLFERNPLPMWVFDRTSLRFLAVNEAAVEHYGYSRERFLSMRLQDIRPAEELDAFEASIRRGEGEQGLVWTHRGAQDRHLRMAIYSRDIVFDDAPARLVLAQDVTELETIQQRFQLIARAASDAIWDWDLGDNTLWWSDSFYTTFGHDRDRVPPTLEAWSALLYPDDLEAVMASLDAAIADPGVEQWSSEYRFLHGDGGYREVLDRGFLLRGLDGTAYRAVGAMLDVTEKHRAESEMRLLQRIVASALNGICIVDMRRDDQPVVYVNPAFEQMTGYGADEVVGRNCRFLQGPVRDENAMDKIHEALRTEQPVQVVLENFRKDGTPFWNELMLSPVRDDGGALSHYVGVQNDVSERYRMESKLAYAASHDTLTGLVNRFELRQHLDLLIADGGIAQHSAALLFIDLDNFKLINDSVGHEAGDQVLKEVARRLLGISRDSDIVARFGGDEFVILLSARVGRLMNVEPVIARIQEALQSPFDIAGGGHQVTASLGYVRLPEPGIDAERLLIHADLAMYEAKQQGRNCAIEYTAGSDLAVSQRFGLIAQLREALLLERFMLHFQPILLPGGEVSGFEALVRWRHPDRGLLAPGEFIQECEASGLIVPLGRWVLREAAATMRRLLDEGLVTAGTRMSVNVSAIQFQNSLVEDVAETMRRFELPADTLELELTESTLMGNTQEALAVMSGLRSLGLQIAIDDFGTGFSSLAYLKKLPINRLKIDRAFVSDLPGDKDDVEICRSIIHLARSMGLATVAEGIETQAQLDWLRAEGCDEMQGFLLSRPITFEALADWLRGRGADASEG